MNVYRVTRLMAGSVLIGAESYAAVSADIVAEDNVTSIEDLGELTFLTGGAEAITGGRQVTLDEAKASITDSHLISFEDNKPYKSLTRHLKAHGLTFDQYKAKWGLPSQYPAIHPSYSMARRDAALAAGLGKKGAGKK